jgi:hypothetical protein
MNPGNHESMDVEDWQHDPMAAGIVMSILSQITPACYIGVAAVHRVRSD